MTWGLVQKVVLLEQREFPDIVGTATHVTGQVQERDCGCYAAVGIRLDKMEPTFGVGACPEHVATVQRTLVAYGALKDNDGEVLELWRSMLDAAID